MELSDLLPFQDTRPRQRTTSEKSAFLITFGNLQTAIFDRAKANGDGNSAAIDKALAALDTVGRVMKLKFIHYLLFLDEYGPLPGAEEKWALALDEALRAAVIRTVH